MITTVLTILLAAIAVIAAIVLAITLIPIGLSGDFSLVAAAWRGTMVIYWIHPRLVRLSYDVEQKCAILKVFRWSRTLFWEEEIEEAALTSAESPEELKGAASRSATAGKPVEESVLTGKKQVRQGATGSGSTGAGQAEGTGPAPLSEAKGRSFAMQRIRSTWGLLRDLRVLPKALRWTAGTLRLALRLLRFDHLRLHARGGADDPAETGSYYGWYRGLHCIIFPRTSRRKFDVRFEPDFSGRPLEVEGSVAMHISIARILSIVMIAAATFPYVTLYRVRRKLKKIF